MVQVDEVAVALVPPGGSGGSSGVGSGGEPTACLVVVHTPEQGVLGKRFLLTAPTLRIGGGEADIPVQGAAESGSFVEISRDAIGVGVIDDRWRLRAGGRVWINDLPSVQHVLRSRDRIRVVETHFLFLSGSQLDSQYHEAIYHLTITDFATGLSNKRFLHEILERELIRARRHGVAASVVVLKFDSPKSREGIFNCQDVLREIGKHLRTQLPPTECVARIGDWEIALVVPERGAKEVETDLREWLQGRPWSEVPLEYGVVDSRLNLPAAQLVTAAQSNAVPFVD